MIRSHFSLPEVFFRAVCLVSVLIPSFINGDGGYNSFQGGYSDFNNGFGNNFNNGNNNFNNGGYNNNNNGFNDNYNSIQGATGFGGGGGGGYDNFNNVNQQGNNNGFNNNNNFNSFGNQQQGNFDYNSQLSSLQPPAPNPNFGSGSGGVNQNYLPPNIGGGEGYIYKVPKKRLRYPAEFEIRHRQRQRERERARAKERGRFQIERERPRDNDRPRDEDRNRPVKTREPGPERRGEENVQREQELRAEEQKLRVKEDELEEREIRLRREREELEDERQNDENARAMLVAELIAEHRKKTLEELSRFGENLKKNQQKEDEAREKVGGEGGRRVRIKEEREEIIRRPGQEPQVVNRFVDEREEIQTGREAGGVRKSVQEEVRTTSRRVAGGANMDGGRVSGGSGASRSSASRSSSSSSFSSSSGSGSSRSSGALAGSGERGTDADIAGSAFIPISVNRFDSVYTLKSTIPPIANDPLFLSVASLDDILERTGASRSSSRTLSASSSSSSCPTGTVFTVAGNKCIKWG